jgi:hypothetical protein
VLKVRSHGKDGNSAKAVLLAAIQKTQLLVRIAQLANIPAIKRMGLAWIVLQEAFLPLAVLCVMHAHLEVFPQLMAARYVLFVIQGALLLRKALANAVIAFQAKCPYLGHEFAQTVDLASIRWMKRIASNAPLERILRIVPMVPAYFVSQGSIP